ncbi:hypothetical protein GGS24DRAFT_511833 [Hypoxylon argillaceum]|nr:hypothetical protein GGS24DRAFT_511833 [Hypoxylon argillaceum]
MEFGTILGILQLSASVFKLGREISLEFFGPENAPEKLRHLNTRLRILNEFLKENLEQPGLPDKLSATRFPGSVSIEKTLKECKKFLENYKSLLSETTRRGSTAQRVLLTVGPDASRIDDFHKKIDQHYAELGHWRMGSLTDKINNLHMHHMSTYPNPHLPLATPQINLDPGLYITTLPLTELPTNQQLISPRTRTSPILRAQSQTTSLHSLPELPSTRILNYSVPASESGSLNSLIGGQGYDSNVGQARPSPRSGSWSGHNYVTLLIGTREGLRFSPDVYKVYEDEKRRVIDWLGPQVRIRHFLPLGPRGIPYTKPKNPKIEVTFLPHSSEHWFEITTSSDETKRLSEKARYQFTQKADRDIFQRQVRVRQYLQMVEVVKIHTWKERNVAMDVHLKVWARNNQDIDPTFSFAYLGQTEPNHHVEYKIRWFKKEPERKGDTRLILRPYSEDTDLGYGPAADDPGKKGGHIKGLIRRMSGSPNVAFASHSPSIGHSPVVLYEGKGKAAPEDERLGYLDIEFQSLGHREKFISACFEASHPTSHRGTLGSDTETLSTNPPSMFSWGSTSASQMTTPQHSVSELDSVSPAVEMGASERSPDSLRLPSPAISRTVPIQFNNLNPFALPDPAVPTACELEARDRSPVGPWDQGPPG